jgi:hypothetical protein
MNSLYSMMGIYPDSLKIRREYTFCSVVCMAYIITCNFFLSTNKTTCHLFYLPPVIISLYMISQSVICEIKSLKIALKTEIMITFKRLNLQPFENFNFKNTQGKIGIDG